MEKVNVRISGYSRNEGSRIFEVLSREEIKKILDELDSSEIYKQTFIKANGYNFSGTAFAYLDVTDGKIKTAWIQSNNFEHPWDSFREIILCTIKSPVEEFTEEDLLDENEMKEFEKVKYNITVEDFIINKYDKKELYNRIDNVIDCYSQEFKLDWDNIKEQLDNLYQCIKQD